MKLNNNFEFVSIEECKNEDDYSERYMKVKAIPIARIHH